MYTSANMGLKIWNLTTDLFDYTQLEGNFAALDVHNHTFGQGVQIPTGGIANGAVTTAKIASNTITGSDINTSTAITVAGATISLLNAGVETASYLTAGNINHGNAGITVNVGNANTLTAFASTPLLHNCVDTSGNPVIPSSILLTPRLNLVTAKVFSMGGASVFGVDHVTIPPTTTTFYGYVVFTTAPTNMNVTLRFDWLAIS